MEQTTKLSEQKYRVEKTSGYVGRSPQWSVLTTDDRLGVVFDDENTATIVCSMLNAEARAAAPQVGGEGIGEDEIEKRVSEYCAAHEWNGSRPETINAREIGYRNGLKDGIELCRSHGLFSPSDQLVKAGEAMYQAAEYNRDDMKILVACEHSGTVRDELLALGHDATSCDILPTDTPGPHYQGDVRDILGQPWDMVIAFPPCTHLAVSGAKHFAQKRADGRQQEGIDFFMLFTRLECPRVAIENPIGIMSTLYRKPDQIVQPYMFGDPVKKTTCLWLKGLPKLVPTDNVEKDVKYYVSKSGAKMSDWYARQIVVDGKKYGYGSEEFTRHRNKTFPGIAKAMAGQWSEALHAPTLFSTADGSSCP